MPLTPEIDFIVVGQGIAGSCLAYELLERGARSIERFSFLSSRQKMLFF